MPYLQATLDHVDAIADWLLDLAESAEERGDLNATLELVRSAAVVLSRQNRSLVSPRAEGLIRRVATSIAMAQASDLPCLASETMRASLHVLSEALPAGGLSAMAQRWICLEPSGAPQHVVLLQQQTPVPEEVPLAQWPGVTADFSSPHLGNRRSREPVGFARLPMTSRHKWSCTLTFPM